MFRRASRRKRTIHVHVGPHKTGASAIRQMLADAGPAFQQAVGATPMLDPAVQAYATALNRRDDAGIGTAAKGLLQACETVEGDLILSCPDLAGDLPGTPGAHGTRLFYARLWPNLNLMRKALGGDDVRFYFFLRAPEAWLHDAYVENLRGHTQFRSWDRFLGFLRDPPPDWAEVTDRPQSRLGDSFVTLPYSEAPEFSAGHALVAAIAGAAAAAALPPQTPRSTPGPTDAVIRLLEKANRSGASPLAIRAAKTWIWDSAHGAEMSVRPAQPGTDTRPVWPTKRERPDWLDPGLEALWSRVAGRIHWQDQPNLLPPVDADLTPLRTQMTQGEGALPDAGRARMEDQARILTFRMQGQPRTCWLLGLVISYLRRHTGHEAHAVHLFQRLWAEEHAILLGFLEPRWLISTFQTFMDHGVTEEQRRIGAAGFFFTNTLKLYEAERALEGLAADATYPNLAPATPSGFWGLDRIEVGGSDMALNTTAHLLELAAREPLVGRVLQEFLLRMKRYHSAFSRMDATRAAHGVDIPPFSDCWSFFEPVAPPERETDEGA